MDITKVIMNPVRQRIVQQLIISGASTVSELSSALSDIPRPSLYRHVKILLDAGCIEVVNKKAVRGAVERTYSLVKDLPGLEKTNANIAMLFSTSLMSLTGEFARYFAGTNPDPERDMLGLSMSTLMLTDAEYTEMMNRIGGVYGDYIKNGPGDGRRARRITVISSPVFENGDREGENQ